MKTAPTLRLNLSGCAVEFACGDRELAAAVAADFSAFPSGGGGDPVRIEARLEAVNRPELALLRSRRYSVLPARPGLRRIWYPEGALCEYDYAARSALIRAAGGSLLKELSYLLILSRAGEELDRRGLHRLHAGALGRGGRAHLFCGPQGTGKTTLLLELLKDRDFSLLSDDTPLVARDGTVLAFPVRVGLGLDSPHLPELGELRKFERRHYPPKRLLDIGPAGIRVSPQLPPGGIFLLRRAAAPRISPAGRGAAAVELLRSLALGCGTPQLAEYFLRPDPADAASKAGILFSRLRAARALLARADFYVFEVGPDRAKNAAAFKSFLNTGTAAA
ncbi:MAG: hypothetical protein A2X29_11790 [Elusimicrobia bacterium GWA2_64_40]|nr:MAG: hypothetical protein A2X29_11790 [Elusimicrobia bacterium GWA2_64_40]OGR67446.1 MAG: hypothetical protein A2X30_05840 [Elusimicrobia bacterium GWB2_63_16]